ncbi:hypothetical protein XfCFBP8082_11105 [Xylella fastidiosa subsp. fastidiosa]|jgi:hypothetical protein|nr:hypothetical protein XFEB_02356 [Xylella fastidiosa EB92.1]QIS27010.1 hypothetical protein F7G16_12265 [Xylella fastidiosa]RWA34649.1 hypothetical protein XfCFBP7970_09975 [Xylella fastidiosa subsp. fastidiosa]RWA39184.1 hypothetical protein XfCFBP8082_11105 [Xylella fastidiosa subsp. fastidiosa]SHH14294.1 hypothetical protein SAMN05660380_02225 [Xylella fastidiosa]
MNRPDFFCEDYREFGDALGDMAKEAKLLALWGGYRDRLLAVALELAAIDGRLLLGSRARSRPCL